MARQKSVPDAEVLALILRHLLSAGDKAVSFGAIAAISGLSAPTLVQRFGSRDAMVVSAISAGWDRLAALTTAASDDAFISAKGAQSLLKDIAAAINIPALLAESQRDKNLLIRAAQWRNAVELALSDRLGGGSKGREAGALMFAAWQGRLMWNAAGGKSFRLGEALRRLAD